MAERKSLEDQNVLASQMFEKIMASVKNIEIKLSSLKQSIEEIENNINKPQEEKDNKLSNL